MPNFIIRIKNIGLAKEATSWETFAKNEEASNVLIVWALAILATDARGEVFAKVKYCGLLFGGFAKNE